MIEIARLVVAALALWFALRGIGRLLRARLRVTGAVVRNLVLASVLLAVAVWLQLSDPDALTEALEGLWQGVWDWVAESVASLFERLVERIDVPGSGP